MQNKEIKMGLLFNSLGLFSFPKEPMDTHYNWLTGKLWYEDDGRIEHFMYGANYRITKLVDVEDGYTEGTWSPNGKISPSGTHTDGWYQGNEGMGPWYIGTTGMGFFHRIGVHTYLVGENPTISGIIRGFVILVAIMIVISTTCH